MALANAYNFLGFYGLVKPNLAFAVARTRGRTRAGDRFHEWRRRSSSWRSPGSEATGIGKAPSRPSGVALALDPANPVAHVHYSWLLSLLGRDDAALAEAQRGQALAPSSRLVAGARAQTLYVGRPV